MESRATRASRLVPDRIGRYQLRVHAPADEWVAAFDPLLDRPVTIRAFPLDHQPVGQRERVLAGLRSHARLHHPSIAPILDLVETDSAVFAVYDDLSESSHANPILEPGRRTAAFHDTLSALDAAHRNGVIHGGLTADRIRVLPAGIRIVDFAIEPATVPATAWAVRVRQDLDAAIAIFRDVASATPALEAAATAADCLSLLSGSDPEPDAALQRLAALRTEIALFEQRIGTYMQTETVATHLRPAGLAPDQLMALVSAPAPRTESALKSHIKKLEGVSAALESASRDVGGARVAIPHVRHLIMRRKLQEARILLSPQAERFPDHPDVLELLRELTELENERPSPAAVPARTRYLQIRRIAWIVWVLLTLTALAMAVTKFSGVF